MRRAGGSPAVGRDALGEARAPAHARAPEPGALAALTVLLAGPGPDAPAEPLGERLRERLAAQCQADAALHTLRRPQAAPPTRSSGQRRWALGAHSWLVELDAGAALSLEPDTHELLLLAGRLDADGQCVEAQDHLLGQGRLRAEQASRFYLRRHGPDGPFHGDAGWRCQRAAAGGWQPLREGVEIRPLHQQGAAVSMLARFAPGARVPAHPHGLDEECLMVEGELFLGELLLREGGFQAAPAGSAHGELFADSPCLLFFHGAIDPAAVDPAWRAARGFAAL